MRTPYKKAKAYEWPESVGRPSLLTEELQEKFVDAISKVLTVNQAAARCGIWQGNAQNWITRGKEELAQGMTTKYTQFLLKVKQAQTLQVENIMQRMLAEEPQKNWQALAWILERCFREEFGQDSGVINDLMEKAVRLAEALKKYQDNPIKNQKVETE